MLSIGIAACNCTTKFLKHIIFSEIMKKVSFRENNTIYILQTLRKFWEKFAGDEERFHRRI